MIRLLLLLRQQQQMLQVDIISISQTNIAVIATPTTIKQFN